MPTPSTRKTTWGALGPKMKSWASQGGKDVAWQPTIGKLTAIEHLEKEVGVRPDMVPFMGFHEEQYVPGHPDKHRPEATGWTAFYTCIANGKRVYVWAYRDITDQQRADRCCVMVSDYVSDPGYNASLEEVRNMFANQHRRNKAARWSRTHRVTADPLVLQAFIHEVTRGGNEHLEWIGVTT